MHEAYTILSSFKHGSIESIAGYGKKLIIGTETGQLYMYSMSKKGTKYQASLYTFYKTEDGKPIQQMKVIPEENLLFVLTNGMINVFYIGGIHFILTQRCFEPKSCTHFAIDVKVTTSELGATDIMIILCASINRVLKFFVWKSERLEAIDKEYQLKEAPKALSLMGNIVCVGYKHGYVAYNIFSANPEQYDLIEITPSENMNSCICLIKNSIFGISKDDFAIFIDTHMFTKHEIPTEKIKLAPVMWSNSVLEMIWDEPYLIGRTSEGVEIHAPEEVERPPRYTLIQSMTSLKHVKFLTHSEKGSFFAASKSVVWYLQMKDIELQKKSLVADKNFNLAIELTKISSESETSKLETIRELRISYANDLFLKKKFKAAIQQFLRAEVDPQSVIKLFPTSIKGVLQGKHASYHPSMSKFDAKDLENAILALIHFLIVARQKEGYSKRILSILDTTLLKCYLETNNSLVGPLIRLKQCDFLESERVLKKHEKLKDLVVLYNVFGEHEKALSLMKTQASIEDSVLFGHDRTVEYLQHLDKDHKDLVFKYSQWILHQHPEDGLKIFTDSYCEDQSKSIPKNEVLNFLSSCSESLVLPYLEHLVHFLNDSSSSIHENLLKAYVRQINKLLENRDGSSQLTWPVPELKQFNIYRSKLMETLEKSNCYCPEKILKYLPVNQFVEERLQVLKRTNKHEEILFIFLQIQGNVQKALEYCETVRVNGVYEILLKILLNPTETCPYEAAKLHNVTLAPNFEAVFKLLETCPTKFDLARVLTLLPGDIPVYRIKKYMETVFQLNIKKRWNCAVLQGISRAEIVRLNRELFSVRRQFCINITERSTCKECQKSFCNGQVFVRNTNGCIVHLACSKGNSTKNYNGSVF